MDEQCYIKKFLEECNDSNSASEFMFNPKIVGNYTLNKEDVASQVIDWIFHYIEDKKWPYNLVVAMAKKTAQKVEDGISEQQLKESTTSDEKLLNSVTLYTDAIKNFELVCISYLENSNEFKFPHCPTPFTASTFAVKNKRRKMEDRHVIHHDLNLLLDLKNCHRHSYYAVFDGHSGVDAASYASAHLHVNIANHPAFLTNTSKAITEAYKTTDQNFAKKCFEENIRSGTTAVCALIRDKTIFLSWVGDSQGVLVKEGKPAIVTSPHKPDREDERKRVEDLGGTIQFIGTYRVNGMLAVTRAIGDADHKPFVSSEPEITVVDLDGSEDFLILACDGLWDGMSPDDVVAALYYNLLENGQDDPFNTMAAKLVHQSKLQGSEDNITAVVLFLRDIKVIKEEAQKYIPNLSKPNLMMNFFETNGDVKQLLNMVTSTPISKPNVLEFNNSSIKKLKNTANVLSAAGLGDSFTDYVETYHASNFDRLNEKPAHPIVAPEATALSELPTPPIDDVIASQQFEKICSTNLAQKFEVISPDDKCERNFLLDSPDINLDQNFIKELPKSDKTISENERNLLNQELSPEEAVDIASTVVSNAIETAVKCISENENDENKFHVSPQKLNPYAEPFVMKSHIQSEINIGNVFPIVPESSFITDESNSKDLFDAKNVSKEVEDNTKITTSGSLENAQKSVAELILPLDNLQQEADLKIGGRSMKLSEDFLLEDMQMSLIENSVNYFETSKNATDLKGDLLMTNSPQQTISKSDEARGNISVQNLDDVPNEAKNEIEESIIEISSQDNLINVSGGRISPLKEFLTEIHSNSNVNSKNSFKQSELKCDLNILAQQSSSNIDLIDISSDSIKNYSDLITEVKSDFPETDNSVKSNNKLCDIENVSGIDFSNVSILRDHQTDYSCKEKLKPDENKESDLCMSSDKIPEVAIILGGVSLPLVDDQTAAVVPSDHSEESHLETVAVDLQSVPVGVPEAEGVTEDVDSDSEKDGGWSYMKGNVAGQKSKSVATKQNISKSKKDAQKPLIDMRNKVKSASNIDKNKKDPTEKKPLELKNKMSKPTMSTKPPVMPMTTSSSKTVVDKSKVATNVAARKPTTAAAKSATIPSSKMSRSATVPRSAPVQHKSAGLPTTSKIHAATKPISSNTNTRLKPNIGVSTVSTASSSLNKKQPSTQSTKSNTLSSVRNTANRPTSSTVPNRALSATKTATVQKAPMEAKPKQLPSTTLKKPVPSTLKKLEVKETKELSNKQLSEKKPLPKTESRGATSHISNNLKSSASGVSKTKAKSQSIASKSDLNKKDVPKTTSISRLATRNTTQVKSTSVTPKSTVKNTLSFQKKAINKSNQPVKADVKNAKEPSPSEEEKLLREVNDVEVPTKELADCAASVDVEERSPLENGHGSEIEEKILNEEPIHTPVENLL